MWPSAEAPERGIFVQRQVEALRALGHEVEVAPLGDLRTGRLATPRKYLRLARDARARVKSFQPDVVHAHFLVPTGSVARVAAGRAGVPYVVTAHGTDVQNASASTGRLRGQTAAVLNDAAAIIAVSGELAARVREIAPDATVHVAHMGVDTTLYAPSGDPDAAANDVGWSVEGSAPRFLAVGSLLANKNHRRLIEAVATLQSGNLALVGAGPMEAHLRDHAVQLGIADRVTFVGRVAPADLARWYNAAHVVALPSINEGFGVAALEGLACGRPVVVSQSAPVAQLVDDTTGAVVDPLDVASIAAGLSAAARLAPPLDAAVALAGAHDVEHCARTVAGFLEAGARNPG